MVVVRDATLEDAERILEIIYEALEKALYDMGILNLYACIGYPEQEDEYLTTNSADFHAHLGFVKVGGFRKCGYKFNHWYNMIWMEKIIGEHEMKQSSITLYPALKKLTTSNFIYN